MKQYPLYTGNGVSLSPYDADGRRVSNFVRLVADEGKGITNGSTITTCVEVHANKALEWIDCEYIESLDELMI